MALLQMHGIIIIINIIIFPLCVAQDFSHQAQSNLSFLTMLREPCEELSQLKPSLVVPKMRHVVSLIRIIWINSIYYNTSDRITGLFRKVSALLFLISVGSSKGKNVKPPLIIFCPTIVGIV